MYIDTRVQWTIDIHPLTRINSDHNRNNNNMNRYNG